jgi:hypothetical protein
MGKAEQYMPGTEGVTVFSPARAPPTLRTTAPEPERRKNAVH